MDEIGKIGDINSINDFFDFKLSIKTIIFIAIIWGICGSIFVVFMLGGVNNTVEYILNISNSTKNSVIKNKNKQLGMESEKPTDIKKSEVPTDE